MMAQKKEIISSYDRVKKEYFILGLRHFPENTEMYFLGGFTAETHFPIVKKPKTLSWP